MEVQGLMGLMRELRDYCTIDMENSASGMGGQISIHDEICTH